MNILGFILIVSGLLVVTYFSGPKSSSEQSNPPLPPQGQVTALPINSPSPANTESTVTIRNKTTGEVKQVPKSHFDYAGAKAAGLSDAEIQNYLASKQGGRVTTTMEPMHSITDTRTGETIHVPESQLGRYGIQLPQAQTHVTKASDKALRLSTYIFTFSNEKTRNELINKFSNGQGNLSLAVTNLALLLDSKPEALALTEKDVAQDIANKKELEERKAIGEYHRKEYERLKAELDNTIAGINNTYTGGAQNTYIKPNLPKETYLRTNIDPILSTETKPKPGFIKRGGQYTDAMGDTHFTNDDGTTGTAHTDGIGDIHFNDNSGYSSSTHRDGLGNFYTTDNQGNTINSYTDILGNTHYNSSNGLYGSSHTDILGNTYYEDSSGNNIRCSTDGLGNKHCY